MTDITEDLEDRSLIAQKVMCPDGTILYSRNRHECSSHTDANGEWYMIDGGREYGRRSVNKIPFVRMNVFTDSPHAEVRSAIQWGTYGKDGKQPLKAVLIKDMSTPHLEAVIRECINAAPYVLIAMRNELEYRKEEGVEHEPSWLES